MKNILHLILFLISLICFAQPQNNLEGLYKGNKKNMYSELDFMGNGYVKINQFNIGEYFHENDSLFVLTGNDVAIYSIQENKIKGISEWIKKEELKLYSIHSKSNVSIFNTNQRAELIKKYYLTNFRIQLEETDNKLVLVDQLNQINWNNSQLCEQGLDLGCIQNFSYLTVLLQSQVVEDHEKTLQDMYDLANRVIALKNADGYGLLFTYFLLKDDEQNADKNLEIGVEKGSQLCMLLSMEKLKQ